MGVTQSSISGRSQLVTIVHHLRRRFGFIDNAVIASRPLRWKFAVAGAWGAVLAGGLVHWLRGQTPKRAHLALVTLFMETGGRANDALARAVAAFHPPYALPP